MPQDYIPANTPVENLKAALIKSLSIAELYAGLRLSLTGIKKVDDYIEGRHNLAFATEKFENAFGALFAAFANNYCPTVVSVPADRMQIEKIEIEGDGGELQKKLDAWLKKVRIDRISNQAHDAAFRYGNGFVVLAETSKPGDWRLYQQRSDEMRVLYDPEEPSRVILAIKVWRQLDNTFRLNVYQQESTLRFVARTKEAETARKETLTEIGGVVKLAEIPMPGTLVDFEPYTGDALGPIVKHLVPGCPVFHFANEPGRDGHGNTELLNVFPLQDALNKSVCDLLVGSEFHAMPQRFATGIEVEFDDQGKPRAPFLSDTSKLWYTGNKEAGFGAFPAAQLEGQIKTGEMFRREIARVARIPLHYLAFDGGSFPSGEALKTAEAPLVAKIEDRQVLWGDVWEDLVRLWLLLTGQGGEDTPLCCDWADTSARNEKEHAETEQIKVETVASKVDLGLPKKEALKELEYSEEQIKGFEAQRTLEAQEAARNLVTAIGQGAGLGPGGTGGGGTGA